MVGSPSLSASQSFSVRNAVTAMKASGNSAESPKQVSPATIDQRAKAEAGLRRGRLRSLAVLTSSSS